MFTHGQRIAEHLSRMPVIGQTIPHRNTGELRKNLNLFLLITAVFDTVKHAPQNASGISSRLLVSHLRTGRIEVGGVRTLIESCHLEGATRARRRLLEDQRNIAPLEVLDLDTILLRCFEFSCQINQRQPFGRSEVDFAEERTTMKSVRHGCSL